jgi:hypothetical protein
MESCQPIKRLEKEEKEEEEEEEEEKKKKKKNVPSVAHNLQFTSNY